MPNQHTATPILPGMTFGRWTAINESGRLRGYAMWLCKCQCGTHRLVRSSALRDGRSQGCGCATENQLRYKTAAIDMIGRQFGRWTVIKPADKQRNYRTSLCKCSCGAEGIVRNAVLRDGKSLSCGCVAGEKLAVIARIHGERATCEYRIWSGMLNRCRNPRSAGWHNYGGRGITVCDRWDSRKGGGFPNFLADMGRRPSPKHSIDRIDNDGPYSPENCRWTTADIQRANQRPRVRDVKA